MNLKDAIKNNKLSDFIKAHAKEIEETQKINLALEINNPTTKKGYE